VHGLQSIGNATISVVIGVNVVPVAIVGRLLISFGC
jgi:hypothetical protein